MLSELNFQQASLKQEILELVDQVKLATLKPTIVRLATLESLLGKERGLTSRGHPSLASVSCAIHRRPLTTLWCLGQKDPDWQTIDISRATKLYKTLQLFV